MVQRLGPELGQAEADSTKAVPLSQVNSIFSMDDNSY